MAFLASMAGLNSVLTPTFAYCLLSDNVTWHLHSIAEHFYYFSWYRLPVKQQKLFIFPIRRAQKPFRMSGHGIVDCSLRVFSSVNFGNAHSTQCTWMLNIEILFYFSFLLHSISRYRLLKPRGHIFLSSKASNEYMGSRAKENLTEILRFRSNVVYSIIQWSGPYNMYRL